MINRETAYRTAFEEQKSSLQKRRAEYDKKLSLLEESEPRLKEIKLILSQLGAKIAITALSGNKKELSALNKSITALTKEKKQIIKKAKIKDFEYICPLCLDTGYIEGKICGCIKQAAKKISLSSLSDEIPLESCRFESFDLKFYPNTEENGENPRKRMTRILKNAKEYAINFNPSSSDNLLFMGSAGLGKTHISLSIVYELLQKDFDVVYSSAHNLFSAMETEHFSSHTNDVYISAAECDLLVIDDLGSEFISPYIQSILYNLINTRLLSRKPTIISTNLSMAQINDRYTPRIASRFIGSYKAEKFAGKDIRQLKRLQNAGVDL